MAEKTPQTYENHGKLVPGYHFVTLGLLFLYILWTAWGVVSAFSLASVMQLLFALGVFGAAFYARVFPLHAQDRVIRLEEKLRLQTVLPANLRERIDEIPSTLFVALRFAPEDELTGLVQRVLDGELKTRKVLKQEIKQWRPDYYRL